VVGVRSKVRLLYCCSRQEEKVDSKTATPNGGSYQECSMHSVQVD
jgi:hypothetical protein